MTLGASPKHDDMFGSSRAFCEEHLAEGAIFRLLAVEGHRLFPDEALGDLFKAIGRRSVAPRIVATVMVLQRLEGLSDREATERFIFHVRWKYAAGVPSDSEVLCTPCSSTCASGSAIRSAQIGSSRLCSMSSGRRDSWGASVCSTPRRSTTPLRRRTP